MKKRTSFNVWNAGGGSFFGNCAANVCPWRSWRGSWRTSRSRGGHAVKHAKAGHVKGGNTLVSVLAVDVVTMLRGPRADTGAMQLAHITGAMQLAHIIGMAAVTGEAVTGEAITGIRPMDILELGYYSSGYGYPYYGTGYYGYRYGGYYPYYGNWGYYPYLYGYWPSVSFSFGY